MQTDRELLASAYKHFNTRDIDSVLNLMHPDVDWPNGMEGGRVHGHHAVRDYWTRQWAILDPHVEPAGFASGPDGRTIVQVHQVVRDLTGKVLVDHMVQHIYLVQDGLIRSMEIRETPLS
ncbi:nuclear transport factor 2 family protein [Tunturibacter empetritectus]|uniref:Ketosteroid isomerase-like protein n=1 Tax=Tunturiibacter empetritectus TaxID=3069691 RepID=A0A7W8IL88_9BACT|nr:nuclear transport factor 2 family protein [Edaphobacter lichenicola]MBB5319280.1 ketosteroid isomerase-like protein [Edaphobacter lichenicola]